MEERGNRAVGELVKGGILEGGWSVNMGQTRSWMGCVVECVLQMDNKEHGGITFFG